jgi:hypothetical protein
MLVGELSEVCVGAVNGQNGIVLHVRETSHLCSIKLREDPQPTSSCGHANLRLSAQRESPSILLDSSRSSSCDRSGWLSFGSRRRKLVDTSSTSGLGQKYPFHHWGGSFGRLKSLFYYCPKGFG